MPRLPRFVAGEPQIDIEVESTEILRELGSETDLAIRYVEGSRQRPQRSAVPLADISIPRRMRFNDVALVLQAAVNGHGVALGDELRAVDDLKAGRLLKPFEVRTHCGTYWLLGASSRSGAQRVFRNWLQEQLALCV